MVGSGVFCAMLGLLACIGGVTCKPSSSGRRRSSLLDFNRQTLCRRDLSGIHQLPHTVDHASDLATTEEKSTNRRALWFNMTKISLKSSKDEWAGALLSIAWNLGYKPRRKQRTNWSNSTRYNCSLTHARSKINWNVRQMSVILLAHRYRRPDLNPFSGIGFRAYCSDSQIQSTCSASNHISLNIFWFIVFWRQKLFASIVLGMWRLVTVVTI